MLEVLNTSLIDVELILQDLNEGPAHGLQALYLERFRFRAIELPDDLTSEYKINLRYYVDLWLEHRRVLERREVARYGGNAPTITHAEARRAIEISQIVGRLADGYTVRPAIRNDSYTFSIAPTQKVMLELRPEAPYRPSEPPRSQVDPDQYPNLEDYAAAVLKEKLAEIPTTSEAVSDETPALMIQTEPSPDETSAAARNAAERVFMEMLASEWRLRIAKCGDPNCHEPYFRLGKWRTNEKAVHCPACRKGLKAARNQERVEDNRKSARRQLCRCAAERFAKQIANKTAWHKDEALKSKIVEFLNAHIESTGGALKSLYPNGITMKWLLSGQGRKNWKLIEARINRAQARSVSTLAASAKPRRMSASSDSRKTS